jgi:hypothetical protein
LAKCSVCSHPDVEAINQAYQVNSLSKISKIFGVNRWTLGRHRACLAGLPSTQSAKAPQTTAAAPAKHDGLQADLVVAREFIIKGLQRAEKRKDYKAMEKFIGLLHENVEISAGLKKKGAKPGAKDHDHSSDSEVSDEQLEQLVGRAQFIPANEGAKN